MKRLKSIAAGAVLLAAGSANAALYNYSSVVTLCTGTCDSFAALAVGTTITGQIEINTTAGGSFTDAEIGAFQFLVTNPALPVVPPVGDPVNDNPLVLDSVLGIAASNGSAGTTDGANELDSGELLIEFLVPPFSSNGAFVVFDLATGNGQVCMFFSSAGCMPGATQAVAFEGSFELAAVPVPAAVWLFGSALAGFAGLRRRRR
ncbi:MAG: VPLPA-CTERM sorting domain-containing protein [Gammaproteobacteria bacterium]